MPEQLSHDDIARQAKELYESELRAILEPTHLDEFVTIEPVSRTYYLGKTFSEAVQKAKHIVSRILVVHAASRTSSGVASGIMWFGQLREIEVVASDVETPLLGVTMQLGHRLVVDYRSFQVELN